VSEGTNTVIIDEPMFAPQSRMCSTSLGEMPFFPQFLTADSSRTRMENGSLAGTNLVNLLVLSYKDLEQVPKRWSLS